MAHTDLPRTAPRLTSALILPSTVALAAMSCSVAPSSLEGEGGTGRRGVVDGVSKTAIATSKGDAAMTPPNRPPTKDDPTGLGAPLEGAETPDPEGELNLTNAFYASLPLKPTGMRRLTRAEFLSETARLVGVAPTFETVALEKSPGSHSTIATTLAVSDVSKARELARAFTDVSARASLATLVPCPATDGPDTACVKAALRALVEKVTRGALSDTEFNAIHARYKTERTANGHEFAVKALLQEMFLSPRFAYLLEGGATPRGKAERLLSRAAFFLIGRHSGAAAALLADGRLTAAEYRGYVDALLASPEVGEGLARVLSHWFGMGSLSPTLKPVEAATLEANVRSRFEADAWTEFRALAEDVLLKSEAPLADLFTTDFTFANGALSTIYGLGLPADASFRKVTLPAVRRGILTTAAVMFASSKEQGRSPMQRGKFLALRLQCHRFPDGAVAQMILPEGAKSLPTLREKLALLERISPCSNCHTMLGAGFAFDRFDPFGRAYGLDAVPDQETVTAYQPPGRVAMPLAGARGAATALAATEDLPRCLTRKAFEFALGREIGKEDGPRLEAAYATFKEQGYKVKPLLRALVSSPEFLAGTALE